MRPRSLVVVLNAVALLFFCSIARAQQTAKIHYIDVGYSDAILLEFNKAAILIDAGGDSTYEGGTSYRLVSYLSAFFNRRPDLNSTIDAIIISDTHHARSLGDVIRMFTVKSLMDSGESSSQLYYAREWIRERGGYYYPINQSTARTFAYTNPSLEAIEALEPDLHFELLGTYEPRCSSRNDSIIVVMSYKDRRFLFAGDLDLDFDLERRSPSSYCISDARQRLAYLYSNPEFLKTDVYKVESHGIFPSTRWLGALASKIAVISTRRDTGRTIEGVRAMAYPLETEVRSINRMPSLAPRTGRFVYTRNFQKDIKVQRVNKAVYCTCWEGDIVIEADTLRVQTSLPLLNVSQSPVSNEAKNTSPAPASQTFSRFDALSLERQKEILSTNGPQLPPAYQLGNVQMRAFIKGGWPFLVYYSITKGTAVLTIAADNVEPFRKELPSGAQKQLIITVPQRFGKELAVARISIEAEGSMSNRYDPSAFEIYAMGILDEQAGTANHSRWRIPVLIDLPVSDITVDKKRIVTSRNEKVFFRFYSRSPYTSGAAEFFRFRFDNEQGVIAERVFASSYDNIKANEQTEQREWDGKDWQRVYSLGTHRLQIRTWRGQQRGGIWFGPYYGPQLEVLK